MLQPEPEEEQANPNPNHNHNNPTQKEERTRRSSKSHSSTQHNNNPFTQHNQFTHQVTQRTHHSQAPKLDPETRQANKNSKVKGESNKDKEKYNRSERFERRKYYKVFYD